MGIGIIVCGLNGAGKSTLGKALAEKLNFYFIDHEDLYFPKTGSDYRYASPCSQAAAEKRLICEIQEHKNFVFASVKGDFGEAIDPLFQYAILIDVSKDIRVQRVKNRSFQQFGSRMLPGGDLHEQEELFFSFVTSRAEEPVERWAQSLPCSVIRVDGTRPVKENVNFIIAQLRVFSPDFIAHDEQRADKCHPCF